MKQAKAIVFLYIRFTSTGRASVCLNPAGSLRPSTVRTQKPRYLTATVLYVYLPHCS